MCMNIIGESHEGRECRLKNLNNYICYCCSFPYSLKRATRNPGIGCSVGDTGCVAPVIRLCSRLKDSA